jgi:hypothetical protein
MKSGLCRSVVLALSAILVHASATAGEIPWAYSSRGGVTERFNGNQAIGTACDLRCNKQKPADCTKVLGSHFVPDQGTGLETQPTNGYCECTFECKNWDNTKANMVAAAVEARKAGKRPDCEWLEKQDSGSQWYNGCHAQLARYLLVVAETDRKAGKQPDCSWFQSHEQENRKAKGACDRIYNQWLAETAKKTKDEAEKAAAGDPQKPEPAKPVASSAEGLPSVVAPAENPVAEIAATIKSVAEKATEEKPAEEKPAARVVAVKKIRAKLKWKECQYAETAHNSRTCWSVMACPAEGLDYSFRVDVRCHTVEGQCPKEATTCVDTKQLLTRKHRMRHARSREDGAPASTTTGTGN